MDGIAPEIAEEVGVPLENYYIHTHAGEQETQHDAGGSASRDTALCVQGVSHAGNINTMAGEPDPLIKKQEPHERDARAHIGRMLLGKKEKAVTLVML